jgi:hypothetical protein
LPEDAKFLTCSLALSAYGIDHSYRLGPVTARLAIVIASVALSVPKCNRTQIPAHGMCISATKPDILALSIKRHNILNMD